MIPRMTRPQADLLWRVFLRDGDGGLAADVAASKLGREEVSPASAEGRLRRLEYRGLVVSEVLTRHFEGSEEPETQRVFSVTDAGRAHTESMWARTTFRPHAWQRRRGACWCHGIRIGRR